MGMRRVLGELQKEFAAVKTTGIAAIFDNAINLRRSWSLDKRDVKGLGKSESLSDTNSYLSLVELATTEDHFFKIFKANRQYRKILEHVTRGFGQDYWEIIKKQKGNSARLEAFISADLCNPFRFTYTGIGRVSSTNLRYAKIGIDLEKLFGSTKDLNIIEIGVGYGGQAIAINELNGFKSYQLIDLPQVQRLAEKYIQTYYPSMSSKLVSSAKKWDLLLSNYAFSELSRDIQEEYIVKYFENSKRGYVIFNEITDSQFSTISVSEFLERIPGSEVLKEIPLTYARNKLIVWGHSNINALVQE